MRNGIIPALAGLAEEGDPRMRSIASAALHQFSQDLLKDPKIIGILMSLLTMDTAILDDCEVILKIEDMNCVSQKGWVLKATECEYRCAPSESKRSEDRLTQPLHSLAQLLGGHAQLAQYRRGEDSHVHAGEGRGGGLEGVGGGGGGRAGRQQDRGGVQEDARGAREADAEGESAESGETGPTPPAST